MGSDSFQLHVMDSLGVTPGITAMAVRLSTPCNGFWVEVVGPTVEKALKAFNSM